jgi:hypothetical protein
MRSLLSNPWPLSPGKSRSATRSRRRVGALNRAARFGVETLETRVLFQGVAFNIDTTLTPDPPPTVTAGSTEQVIITYMDENPNRTLTGFAASNISIVGPGTVQPTVESGPVAVISGGGSTAVVTYTVLAPAGAAWNGSENGTYEINLNAGVTDTTGNDAVDAQTDFGAFTVAVGITATLQTPNTVFTGTTEPLVVTYIDPTAGQSLTGFGASNLSITAPSGEAQPTIQANPTVTLSGGGSTAVVTYTVEAPGATNWTEGENGNYTVSLNSGITDTPDGHTLAAISSFGTFTVDVGPNAVLDSAPDVTLGAAVEDIVVTYTDSGSDLVGSTLVAPDVITVTGPAGLMSVAQTVTNPAAPANAQTETVTYSVFPPGGGTFTAADEGFYTIALSGTPSDVLGNKVTADADFGDFEVGGSSLTGTLVSAPAAATGAATENLVVTYIDSSANILANTLGTDNITVTAPGGGQLMVASITPAVNTDGLTETVTYTVDAPGGAFTLADDGTYTIGLRGAVRDNSGNTVTANADIGTFTVGVTDVPTGVLTSAPSITAAGGNTESIVVTYSDPDAAAMTPVLVDGATIGDTNISILSPNGTPVTITAVTPAAPANASPLVVTYTASLPTGLTWSDALDGTYTIILGNTATNTAGNATAISTLGSFSVSIAETSAPTATVSAPNLLESTSPDYSVVVTYTDDVALLTSSVGTAGADAITVRDPATGEVLDVVSESIPANAGATPRTLAVTYVLQQPEDANFSALDNGTYIISLTGAPHAVTNTGGIAVAANPNFGSFTIDIANTTRPLGTVLAPDITTNGITGETITFVFTDTVAINASSIMLDNLSVVGATANGSGSVTLTPTSLAVSSAINAETITAVYTVAAPFGSFTPVDNGTYSVNLSGVTDVSGLSVLPESIATQFVVDIQGTPQSPFVVGQFGTINGKSQKLKFRDVPAGTALTITGVGGVGTVTEETNGSLDISLVDAGSGLTVKVLTANSRPITFGNLTVDGTINNFQSNTGNMVGVFQATGNIKKATFAHLDGDVVATGQILNLNILRAITQSEILSGVHFGANGLFGIDPTTQVNDDTYGAGYIGSIKVGGNIADSIVAAGDNPGPDGLFGTSDDFAASATPSVINTVTAARVDSISRFLANSFGVFRLGGKKLIPNPAVDPRFVAL